MQEFKNVDGTYTSPKNGKIYKSEKALRAHLSFKVSDKRHNWKDINVIQQSCQYCKENVIGLSNLQKHEDSCYLNPSNKRLCEVCNNPIKDYKRSKGTCSHSCSNNHFAELRNKPENYKSYTTICFHHHEKKCVVCGEENIVAVHHYDENHKNNDPANLVPMCPTHHQYIHSRYKDLVIDIVDKYVKEFRKFA